MRAAGLLLLATALPIGDFGPPFSSGMRTPGADLDVPAATSAIPTTITVATSRGEATVEVRYDYGHPALASVVLERLLPIEKQVAGGWADVRFAEQPFRFLLGAPAVVHAGRVVPLTGTAYLLRDSLFLPLEWLAEHIPRQFTEGYRYDPLAARFEEARAAPVVRAVSPAAPLLVYRRPSAVAARNGFRMQHTVVIDPGHGGHDPGTAGRYFPRGVQEKHVALAIGKMVRDELTRRGVEVVMTREQDVYVPHAERTRKCRDDCALFVSVHVNSAPSTAANGVETYFLGDALTADAARVARMENEALLRYETHVEDLDGAIGFILKDLHMNAYVLESAILADAIQRNTVKAHPGVDRGVAQARFIVLATARRPAVLVETGYATNRRDAQYLAAPAGQAQIAKGIAEGITAYLLQYERKVLAGGGGP